MDERGCRDRKESCIWNDIHGESQSDIFVSFESIPVIPEVVLRMLVAQFDLSFISSFNDVIPKYYLVDRVVGGLIMSSHVQEDLLRVPVKDFGKIAFQIECQETKIILLSTCRVIGHILDNSLASRQFDVHDFTVVFEGS